MSKSTERLGRRQAGWLLALILLAGAAIYVVPIWWGFPTGSDTWAFDEITPQHVTSKWPILYPPAHRHLLTALFAATDHAAELTGRHEPDRPTLLLASRALSVLLACLTALVVYRCARRLSDRATSLLSVTAVVFGTNYVFYAKTANLDIPYLFWFTLSLLFFLRCLEHRRWSDHVLFAACGTLAIVTKTQAYALYLLAPVALVFNLRPPGEPVWSSWRRALFDRRILEAAGACVALTLVLFGELRGSGELREHVAALTSLDFADYRTVALSPRGLLRLAIETLRLTSFVLGAPVFLAALAGLGMAVARPRRNARLLSLLLFAAPYWVVFVAATGFNYDRHYLPITVVLGLFAGKALAGLAALGPPLRRLRLAAVSLVVAYSLWCGVSVDLMLLGDARYEVERWVVANGLKGKTVGLGARERLPRGLPYFPVSRFALWRQREHGTNPRVWHNCLALSELDVEYLVPDTPAEMRGPGLNYREYRRFPNAMPVPLANPEGVTAFASNVVKVAQDVVVFRRTGERCVDSALVPRTLDELRRRNEPERRAQLARAIFESPSIRPVPLAKGQPLARGQMAGVRLLRDRWTAGTAPAGIAVQNLGWREERPDLLLRLSRHRAPFPVTAFVDDGTGTRSFVFDRPAETVVPLPAVAPGERSLTIIWSDKGWPDNMGTRRGIRVLPATWPGSPEQGRRQLHATLRGLSDGTVEPAVRAELARAIGRGGVEEPIAIDDSALMVGGSLKGWTDGTEPAAVLVRNSGERAARVALTLGCDNPWATEPVVAFVDRGGRIESYQLDCTQGERQARLDRLAPGGERLYIVWADRARPTTTEPVRMLGVRLEKVRLIGEEKVEGS